MALNPTPTTNFSFDKFDFGDFGWHLRNNANWDKTDTFFQDVFNRLSILEALIVAPVYSWTDQFFDTDETAPAQVIVNETPALRYADAAINEAGAFLVIPEGLPIASQASLRLKISQPSPGAGTVRFITEVRINGGPITDLTNVDIDPQSTAANQHEVIELLQFDAYDLQGEDDLLVKVKRDGIADSFSNAIDVYAVMMTPV